MTSLIIQAWVICTRTAMIALTLLLLWAQMTPPPMTPRDHLILALLTFGEILLLEGKIRVVRWCFT